MVLRPLKEDSLPSNPKRITEKTHVVPAGHGYSFEVQKGTHFRVVDLHGTQVVDFVAWVPPSLTEKVSMAYTRYHLSGATPTIGECLYTNADRPLFKVVADTVKTHDMTFMACFPKLYEDKGLKGHRSCAANVAEVMAKYGLGDGEGGAGVLDMPDPFNIFQNTPLYTLKPLGCSKPGDYIEFEVLEDAVCAVSCCPYEIVSPGLTPLRVS